MERRPGRPWGEDGREKERRFWRAFGGWEFSSWTCWVEGGFWSGDLLVDSSSAESVARMWLIMSVLISSSSWLNVSFICSKMDRKLSIPSRFHQLVLMCC